MVAGHSSMCQIAKKKIYDFIWLLCLLFTGSYFARDAKYSHSYTKSSGIRTMFVCRVLVGDYTKGNSSYLRPPSKDRGDVHFYDSCVDDMNDPSIYVVFEKHQVYPEYLIQYNEDMLCHPHGAYSNYSNVPPRPRAAPQPAPSAAPYPSYSHINSNSSASTSTSDSNSSCVINWFFFSLCGVTKIKWQWRFRLYV